MNLNLIFLVVSTTWVGLSCYGNEKPTSLPYINSLSEKYPHHIYIGPEVFLFDLSTHVEDIKIDGTKFFGGLRLRYEYLKPWAFYAGIDLFSAVSNNSFDADSKSYDFHRNNGITGFGNFEFRFGYTAAIKKGMLSPFLGIGGYAFGNNGHNFHFNESMIYFAAGMRSLFALNRTFNLGVNWKVFYTDDTEERFRYKFMGHKIKRKEDENVWGGEIGLPCVWRIGSSKNWEIQLEPYFLKLDFSEVQNIYGTRLLFGFCF